MKKDRKTSPAFNLSERSDIPGRGALARIYDELLAQPNVEGCFVGTKYRGGRPTRQRGIICCVSSKQSERKLAKEERIPREIAWLDPLRRAQSLVTDVQEMVGSFEYHTGTVAGPGDYVERLQTGEKATVGYALDHPIYGPVVTTAGHLFPDYDQPELVAIVTAGVAYRGVAVRCRITRQIDYALIKPEDSLPCDNRFRDQYTISSVYWPTPPDDLGKELLILPPTGAWRRVRCRGLIARLKLSNGRVIDDGIVTDLRTTYGDSGACVVGPGGLVWGLLAGRFDTQEKSYSVFVQALSPLIEENATFIHGRPE